MFSEKTYLGKQPLEVLEHEFLFLPLNDLLYFRKYARKKEDEEILYITRKILQMKLDVLSWDEWSALESYTKIETDEPLFRIINDFFNQKTYWDFLIDWEVIVPEIKRYFILPSTTEKVYYPAFYPWLYDKSIPEKWEIYLGILYYPEKLFLFVTPDLVTDLCRLLPFMVAKIPIFSPKPSLGSGTSSVRLRNLGLRITRQLKWDFLEIENGGGFLHYAPIRSVLNRGLFLPQLPDKRMEIH